MSFTVVLSFVKSTDRDAFEARALSRVRAHKADTAPADSDDGLSRLALTVTSSSAARDLCAEANAYLAHSRGSRIGFTWSGQDGEIQTGDIVSGGARDADLLATRLGAAAKLVLGAQRSS